MYSKQDKTLKRKHRATSPTRFGTTLQSLLNASSSSDRVLNLKPSASRLRQNEAFDRKARQYLITQRKEKEEKNHFPDIIGDWQGDRERTLRKVAQRGVVKLFNTIQQTQALTATSAPTATDGGNFKRKGKQRSVAPEKKVRTSHSGLNTETALAKTDFLSSIRAGGIVVSKNASA